MKKVVSISEDTFNEIIGYATNVREKIGPLEYLKDGDIWLINQQIKKGIITSESCIFGGLLRDRRKKEDGAPHITQQEKHIYYNPNYNDTEKAILGMNNLIRTKTIMNRIIGANQ